MPLFERQRVLSGDFFEGAVEIGQAFEAACKAYFGHVSVQQQQTLGLIDAVLIQKFGKCLPGHFFEVPAKGRLGQVTQFGYFVYVYFALVVVINKLVEIF